MTTHRIKGVQPNQKSQETKQNMSKPNKKHNSRPKNKMFESNKPRKKTKQNIKPWFSCKSLSKQKISHQNAERSTRSLQAFEVGFDGRRSTSTGARRMSEEAKRFGAVWGGLGRLPKGFWPGFAYFLVIFGIV